jgi:hypothetical protein
VDRRQFRVRLIRALFPFRGWLARLRLFVLRLVNRPSPFDAVLDALAEEARRQTQVIITEYLMAIGLSGTIRLRLGSDVVGEFPASLREIALPDLRLLLDHYDPTPDSLSGSGAVTWSNLPERLHFIIDMFRCYHETLDLFEPPFTEEQVTTLKAGRLPTGQL